MVTLYLEEPPNHPKKCKILSACLKEIFFNCHAYSAQFSTSNPKEDYPTSEFDDDDESQEQKEVVLAIRNGAIEKLRKRPTLLMSNTFSRVYSPLYNKELYSTPKGLLHKDQTECIDGEYGKAEDFMSVKSCLSCCSSAPSRDVFFSMKTSFSRRSASLNNCYGVLDLNEFRRRSMLEEFCQCEGWPFGLCRKAVLLPPLPKSPSEPWLWRKSTKTMNLTY